MNNKNNDVAAQALALEALEQPSTLELLADRTIEKVDNQPHISRVDSDAIDGAVIVYFKLENHSYFLAVQVSFALSPNVCGVSIAAGNECYLTSLATHQPLSALLSATSLSPSEQWDSNASDRPSGVTIKTPMPLANSVDNNLNLLCHTLEKDAVGIQKLASISTDTFIQIHWYAPAGQLPSIRLHPKTLQRIAALNLAVDFDLYSS